MPTPSPRNPIRIARGLYADLVNSLADLKEGEICFATDQNVIYVKENGLLTSTNGTGITLLSDLSDVNTTSKVDKSVLVWNEDTEKFTANDLNTIITITDGGSF